MAIVWGPGASPSLSRDHWAVESNAVDETKDGKKDHTGRIRIVVLAWGKHPEIPVVVSLNPTDSRGFRAIATVSDAQDPRKTFNRPASFREQAALHAALALVRCAFESAFDTYAQVFVAGNNAHGGAGSTNTDRQQQQMLVGTPEHPHIIHGHVVARASPGWVVPGLEMSVGGPEIGEEFALLGPKRPWLSGEELERVRRVLEVEILRLADDVEVQDAFGCRRWATGGTAGAVSAEEFSG
jgi:HIT-related